jgi:hypothetical protein
MPHPHAGSWTQRTASRDDAPPEDDIERRFPRQEFHYPRASLGAAAYVPRRSFGMGIAGHLVYTAGALAPILIGEFIEDPKQRWRWTRLASVVTALSFETLHVIREEQRRKEQDARLAECHSRCPG